MPMARTANGIAMTQDYTPGALALAQDDGAIAINGGNSAGDYLDGTLGTPSLFNLTGSLTIAAWVKPFLSASTFKGPVIGVAFDAGFGICGWMMYVDWPTRDLRGFRRQSGTGASVTALSGGVLGADAWAFCVYTHSDTGPTDNIYINGSLQNTTTGFTGSMPTFNTRPTMGYGFQPLTAPAQKNFLGGIDEVAVWNVALTAGNVSTLYAAATT